VPTLLTDKFICIKKVSKGLMALTFLQMFQLYGEANKIYKLIIMQFSDPFLHKLYNNKNYTFVKKYA
jgi:hypothetical protein